jgi:hypothetical protein
MLDYDPNSPNGATVNVHGAAVIESIVYGSAFPTSPLTINIGSHSRLTETIHAGSRTNVEFVGINHSSLLINDGPSFISSAMVDVDVGGHGSWDVSGLPGTKAEFTQKVGHGQTISLSGGADLIVDQLKEFKALVNIEEGWTGAAPPFGILLEGIHGDAFTYRDDVLRITSGHRTEGVLRLHEVGGERFSVTDTAAGIVIGGSGGSVAEPQASSGIIPHVA